MASVTTSSSSSMDIEDTDPECAPPDSSKAGAGPSWAKLRAKPGGGVPILLGWVYAAVASAAIFVLSGTQGADAAASPWFLPAMLVLLGLKMLTTAIASLSTYEDPGIQGGLRATGILGQIMMVVFTVANPFGNQLLTFLANAAWSASYGLVFVVLLMTAEFPKATRFNKVMYAMRQWGSFIDTASDLAVGITLLLSPQRTDFELVAAIIILLFCLINGKSTDLNVFSVKLTDKEIGQLALYKIVGEIPVAGLTLAVTLARPNATASEVGAGERELFLLSMRATVLAIIIVVGRWVALRYFGISDIRKASSRLLRGSSASVRSKADDSASLAEGGQIAAGGEGECDDVGAKTEVPSQ